MRMHDGWLGRGPSTAPENDDCDNSQNECVRERVCIMFLLTSIRQAEGRLKGNSFGEIKGAGGYQQNKCWFP